MNAYRFTVEYPVLIEGWGRYDEDKVEVRYRNGTVFSNNMSDAEMMLKERYTMKDATITLREAGIIEDR